MSPVSVCVLRVTCEPCPRQYTQYLEPHSVEEARAVFRRACQVHLTHKPNIHMQWATFEERHGTLHTSLMPLRGTNSVYAA